MTTPEGLRAPRCEHDRTRILTYNMPGYRWLEQCQECGALFTVDDNNGIRPVPLPAREGNSK